METIKSMLAVMFLAIVSLLAIPVILIAGTGIVLVICAAWPAFVSFLVLIYIGSLLVD